MPTKRLLFRIIFTLTTLTTLFFSNLGMTPAYANSIVVNTATDEITTNSFCSLREAITNANSNAATYPDCATGSGIDTITFAGNYTITLVGSQLPAITSAILIYGNGVANTIIQANANPNTATYRVFSVTGVAGNLSLESLTVRHGRCIVGCSGELGGGIFSSDKSTLTVTNSIISGNSAKHGGGIYSEYNTITVTNSIISGNSASSGGGGIYSENNTVNVTNSTISGNNAAIGGGIYTYGGILSMVISNSTFSGNYAATNGGGILNNSNSSITILGSTFFNNSAGEGGALYNIGNLRISNSTLSGNEAYDYGGGIMNQGNAWIHNSSIVFNTLIEGTNLGAGGIDGNVALYNSIVAGNTRAISSTYRDCNGTINSEGVNLFWDTTNCTINVVSGSWNYLNSLGSLGPLQNNGGPTLTHALLPGSNAINAGFNALCASWPVNNLDQRGTARPQEIQCDVGAYEFQILKATFFSVSANDGYILESTETSNTGGSMNSAASTFILGDNSVDRQFRTILHFNTSSLPDNAVITSASIKILEQSISGSSPFNVLGSLYVDMRRPSFGNTALELADFSNAAKKVKVGVFNPNPVNGWYTVRLNNGGRLYINRAGATQFRLYFSIDDNDDLGNDLIRFFSGNDVATNRPKLIIQYYVP